MLVVFALVDTHHSFRLLLSKGSTIVMIQKFRGVKNVGL